MSTEQQPHDLTPWSIAAVWAAIQEWAVVSLPWYLASMVTHLVTLLVLALALGTIHHFSKGPEATFEVTPDAAIAEGDLRQFEVGETPLDPSELNTDTLLEFEAKPIAQEAQYNDDSDVFEEAGGGRDQDLVGPELGGAGMSLITQDAGPALDGDGGLGVGLGTGVNPGSGGAGMGFAGRGRGHRDKIAAGATKASERAVAAALNWLALHQNGDGSWSLSGFTNRCKHGHCDGPGIVESDSAATAMGLLPFLAAGQTHKSKGPYQAHISKGLKWLVKQQRPDGDLSGNTRHQMYSHALATITLCEAYGMSKDSWLRASAQLAVDFTVAVQDPSGGGWRYLPQERGDTSVMGWQLMALKSAQMAGLNVPPASFELAKKFLSTVTVGNYGGMFCYQPGAQETVPLTSVGMLCRQYLGAARSDPGIVEGTATLMSNLPDITDRNIYYWYYATQAMHNQPGNDWTKWNRAIRELLIQSQEKEGCEAGSWSPDKPHSDAWGHQGGRVMVTSLSCLTLEVYYRYLPIYQLDKNEPVKEAPEAEEESGEVALESTQPSGVETK